MKSSIAGKQVAVDRMSDQLDRIERRLDLGLSRTSDLTTKGPEN